ncbi:MAG TPA: ABC transporter ATP-binding protein, partial [Saprospiraceae bacterium]|nr:ABC transporter ATP-binding protein [Saprospiraceae bacterium]
RYLSLFFMAPVRNGIVRDIRQNLFNKTLALPLSYFSEQRKGDLMSRITADVQEIEWSILNVLEVLVREPLMVLGSLGMMLFFSPSLTGFVIILLLFTAIFIGGIGRVLKRQSMAVQESLGTLVSMLEESLSGLRIIKGFNAEDYQSNKFKTENDKYKTLLTRLLWRRDLSSPLSEFLGITIVTILMWYGYHEVQKGILSVPEFLAFLYAFFSVIAPAKSFTNAFYNIQKGMAAIERIDKIQNAKIAIPQKENAKKIRGFHQAIEFQNVGFWYNESDKKILHGINLLIPKGKIIALVGSSGAGKSTIADLLPRFYDVQEGGIFIDNINIKEYKLKDLRSLMGIVSQEAILFNDTIYNNIVFGLKNVSQKEVEKAAKIAHAHEFILATEKAYQSNIGDRGAKLSGGQRQRLAIARAILKNPPILILDEATSALDSESEQLVKAALFEVMKNRTSIVIAHRLSTIQHADEILVIKDGRITERGKHEELLQLNGDYRKLVELQAFG